MSAAGNVGRALRSLPTKAEILVGPVLFNSKLNAAFPTKEHRLIFAETEMPALKCRADQGKGGKSQAGS
jgi:hypothetical protein